ncbi:MAG: hydrogenase maturation protease [Thermoanaerobaculia bacterium]
MSTIVVGLGNAWRGDDAAGLLVLERLRPLLSGSVRTVAHEGDGLSLLDLWTPEDDVILIDAVLASGRGGPVLHDACARPLPPDVQPLSGHALSAAGAIELARVIGWLPRRLIVVGVPAHSFGTGDPLSAETNDAIEEALETVRHLVS